MKKIIKYVVIDIMRNRIVIAYALFLLCFSFSIFNLEDNPGKGLLSLLNIILIIVPLMSILFTSIYIYNSAEFLELLISQPLKRKAIWISFFTGLSFSLLLAFLTGVGIPVMLYQPNATGITLLLTGSLLSVIFVSIAMLAVIYTRDKAKGIGIVILLWLYFSLLFDSILLFLIFQFADYPIEKAAVGISALNPVDLARVLILLKMDVSALMGYTGAVFKNFLGSGTGIAVSFGIMVLWIVAPLLLSMRKFNRKDL
jgi:Cu-processing system permease protein